MDALLSRRGGKPSGSVLTALEVTSSSAMVYNHTGNSSVSNTVNQPYGMDMAILMNYIEVWTFRVDYLKKTVSCSPPSQSAIKLEYFNFNKKSFAGLVSGSVYNPRMGDMTPFNFNFSGEITAKGVYTYKAEFTG